MEYRPSLGKQVGEVGERRLSQQSLHDVGIRRVRNEAVLPKPEGISELLDLTSSEPIDGDDHLPVSGARSPIETDRSIGHRESRADVPVRSRTQTRIAWPVSTRSLCNA